MLIDKELPVGWLRAYLSVCTWKPHDKCSLVLGGHRQKKGWKEDSHPFFVSVILLPFLPANGKKSVNSFVVTSFSLNFARDK